MSNLQLATLSPSALAYFDTGGSYQRPPHIRALELEAMALAGRESEFLIVNMPPRHGKSEYISKYFPAWYLSQFPTHRVALASYGDEFAASWGRKVRDLCIAHGSELGIQVRGDVSAQNEWELTTGGGMFTTGVGGTLTGRGANLIIIDDPIKNAEEAQSPTMREKVWDWWQSVVFTRRQPDCVVIIMLTRWHQDDLVGRLRAQGEALGWRELVLPAIAEGNDPLGRQPGEALWPKQYPLSELQRIKGAMHAHWWSALYQQRPQPIGDTIFRESWKGTYQERNGIYYLRRAKENTPRMFSETQCIRFGMMDLAASTKTSADYTVLTSWAMTPERDLILLGVDRRQLEGPEQIGMMQRAMTQHKLRFIGVEAVAYQLTLLQYAKRANIPVKAVRADKDKLSRALSGAVAMENGRIFLPEWAPWLSDFEAELYGFPTAPHDDQVDTLAYAAIYAGHRALQGTA